ncbi:glycosyltransferase [Tepidamorphus sp. 3E244]|uniref:glycosyltransferase n=1 Tax=Tepidamorphus sp. 3E244 TaxID=3385498 RepID=UPI0038FCD0C6
MRFAFFITDLAGGGAERVTVNLADALHARGHDVTITTVRARYAYQAADGIAISPLVQKREPLANLLWRIYPLGGRLKRRLAELEREGPIDLMVSALPFADAIASRVRHPRLVFHLHGPMSPGLETAAATSRFKHWRKRRRLHRVYGDAPVLSVADGVASDLAEKCGVRLGSVHPIANAIDAERVRALATEPEPRLPVEPFLVHVGRMVSLKRHDLLLEGFRRADVAHKLVLIGEVTSKVQRMIADMGLSGRVLTPGFRANPFPWIKAADGLLLTSDYEGMPMVLLEALACGTPVISTDCPAGGPRQVMRGDLERFLFPVGDASALSDRIRLLVSDPPEISPDALHGFRTEDAVATLESIASRDTL